MIDKTFVPIDSPKLETKPVFGKPVQGGPQVRVPLPGGEAGI